MPQHYRWTRVTLVNKANIKVSDDDDDDVSSSSLNGSISNSDDSES